jgi:hypothetical protein
MAFERRLNMLHHEKESCPVKSSYPLKPFLLIAVLGGGISVILSFVLPEESAWILGLSRLRLLIFLLSLLGTGGFLYLLLGKLRDSSWREDVSQKIRSVVDPAAHKTHLIFGLLGGFAFGIFFLIYTWTTKNPLHQAYFTHLVPLVLWGTIICGATFAGLVIQNPGDWFAYLKKHGLALLALSLVLGAGYWVHQSLPEREEPQAYGAADVVDRRIMEQDIYLVYKEGAKLAEGENPYARAVEIEEIRWNRALPTYLPIIYYGSWLTHEAGFGELFAWLGIWKRVFLFFNLALAYLIFNISHHRYQATALGVFGALFWLFNRWAVHVTTIYHFNVIPVFFLVLSLALLPRRKMLSYLFFGLSLGLKHNAIFLVPIYLIWAWQDSEEKPFREVVIAALAIGGIPLLASLPFLIDSPLGFFKSLMISLTRYPETHLGVMSLDAWLGWIGIPAKIPLLVMVLAAYWVAWRGRLKPFTGGLLIMLVFVNFHSVLFRHYMVWVMPLLPLVAGATYEKVTGTTPRALK